MDEIRNDHDLKAWQQAMDPAPVVYRLVKQLPAVRSHRRRLAMNSPV